MPATNTVLSSRFVRRTTLTTAERRINFHQVDHDVVATVCSDEAAEVTDKMSKIYLRLVSAPRHFWQSEGVLCFAGEGREDKWLTGYERLIELLGVSSATAAKALAWMSEQGIIGYSSPKNGHATRIWLNRAASSISSTPQQRKGNLRLVGATAKSAEANSFFGAPALKNEPAFKEAVIQDTFEINLYPDAPKHAPDAHSPTQPEQLTSAEPLSDGAYIPGKPIPHLSEGAHIAQQIERLAADVEKLQIAIAQKPSAGNILAAVSAAVRAEINDQLEHQFNLTRCWLRDKALPQVSRISQGETFKLLRATGLVKSKAEEKAAYVGASTPRPASYQGGGSDSPKAANDDLLAAAEAVWLIADLQKLDLETCLREVIAEKSRGQGENFATQYEQKLRELVYGTEVHDRIREKLEWWSPDMSRCRSGASPGSDKDDPREKQDESGCPSSNTNLSSLRNPAGDNFQKTEASCAPLPTARPAP